MYDYEGTPFPAVDGAGRGFFLTPLYRFETTPAGDERVAMPEYLVRLRTDGWRWADREAKGRYRLGEREPPVILTSDHPDAV